MNGKRKVILYNWLKSRKRIIIGLCTLIFIVIMVIIVDIKSLVEKIAIIGILGFFIFSFIYTLAFLFRSYKLKRVFIGIEQEIGYFTCYFSIGISFFINDLTPGKLGDIAKMAVVKDQENISFGDSVCGITFDRVIDLFLLFLISLFALIYISFLNIDIYNISNKLGLNLQIYLIICAILLFLILIGFLLIFYKTNLILKPVNAFSHRLAFLLENFITNFKQGLKKFKRNKIELIYIFIIGTITWLLDTSIIVLFFYILGYELNAFILILALIISYFFKTFPITPGGWGISENIGAIFIFFLYPEIAYIEILSIFIIDHIMRSVYIFIYGGCSMFHYNFKLKEVKDVTI